MKKRNFVLVSIVIFAILITFAGCNRPDVKATANVAAPAVPAEKTASSPAAPAVPAEKPASKAWEWNQRIELMVPAFAGGGLDTTMRKFVPYLEDVLGQTVTIVNQGGSSGVIGYTWSHNSKSDGFQFQASAPSSIIADGIGLYKGFKLMDVLIPVSGLTNAEGIVFSKKNAPWTNAREMIAYAKEHPGKVTIAVDSVNGITGAIVKEFENSAGITLKWIPSEATEGFISNISGDIDLSLNTWTDVGAYVDSGDLDALLVLSPKRNEAFSKVPCSGELGITSTLGYNRFFTALEGTPKAAVDSFSAAVAKAAANPEWLKYLSENGMTDAVLNQEELGAMIKVTYQMAVELNKK
ncbi:MAG: tripartite tricarboxylate transporter substrate-binding protein [Sphaerochaetaceae bacterium]|nr:tripartite tricarboxylate transporter substrate-binding protein [Sphaerochaetaceae bacterium]